VIDMHKAFTIFVAWSCLASQMNGQAPPQTVERPRGPLFIRSYERTTIPPVELKNSDRLHELIRAGKLYLTLQDAIAVAIENNLDLEVNRYGPLVADWNLERLNAGGPLRGVTAGNSLVNQATGGQGVAGSQLTAGVSSGGGGGGGGGTNATVSQIGPITPNLDAVLQNTTLFSHTTTPQQNTTQSQTAALVDTTHRFNTFVQQGLLSGGIVQISANESYLKENAPTNILNPSVAPVVQVFIRHNFLQGFGIGVNSRDIRVAGNNIGAARQTFRSQLLNLVANVVNLYWDLVTANEDLKVRQRALDAAQKTVDDTKHQIEIGVVAKVEAYRAEAGLSSRRQELAISNASIRQQENLLKNTLSRNGLEDPLIDAAEVVPLDRIQVPDTDDLPPLRDLLARALAHRPDVALSKIANENQDISAVGTASGILPILQGIASTTNVGLAGVPGHGIQPDAYYVGGLGTALGQVFRRNYPTERGAVQFQASLGNRIAQGDYGVDRLQLRQGDLTERRNRNQLVVDISNQMVALRQARIRYSTARDGRALQQELLVKSQQMFSYGAATIRDVVAAQSSLLAAESLEIGAQSAYSHARTSLDQVLGETLETHHVSVDDALTGRSVR